jgi:hypothetical protein
MYLKGILWGSLLPIVKPEVVAVKVSTVRDHWGRHQLKCQTCDAVRGAFSCVGNVVYLSKYFFSSKLLPVNLDCT